MDKYLALKNKIQEVREAFDAIGREEHEILGFEGPLENMQTYLQRLHSIYQEPDDYHEPDEDYERFNRIIKTGSVKDCMDEAKRWIGFYVDEEDTDLTALSTATMLIDRALELL